VSLAGVGAALLLAACNQAAAQAPRPSGSPAPPTPRRTLAAADAGGVCRLLDFDAVARTIGLRFDVAAAGGRAGTSTCVLRSSAAPLPELVLTVSPTAAGPATFRDTAPAGARAVKSLGRAGYRATEKAAKGRGPVAEVGWLGGDRRLLSLRLTLRAGTPRGTADKAGPRLAALARLVDFVRA
jgi:hypothetical protein